MCAQGVTSMSADTHKFGLADKGTSVVLYASPEHRMLQYTSITDWSGGLYISPTMVGGVHTPLLALGALCVYAACICCVHTHIHTHLRTHTCVHITYI